MHRALVFGLCCMLAALQPARAAQQIGVTVDAQLRVATVGAAGKKILITSAPVFANDRLNANATGLAQIRFIDDTKLVLGPNSSVTLDKFVFSGTSSARTVSVSVAKGAFRFISGRSGSRAYSIRTPAGSIGVRGTAFDVTVQGGTTNVVLLRGQVNICPRNGNCRMVRAQCEYIAFNRRGFVQRGNVAGLTSAVRFRSLFPLLSNTQAILPQFQGGASGCRSATTTQPSVQHARATAPSANPPAPPSSPEDPGGGGGGGGDGGGDGDGDGGGDGDGDGGSGGGDSDGGSDGDGGDGSDGGGSGGSGDGGR